MRAYFSHLKVWADQPSYLLQYFSLDEAVPDPEETKEDDEDSETSKFIPIHSLAGLPQTFDRENS